jgi:hypothetical protein
MAEKNTLSILETIKKKMSKFDQKAEKTSKLADLNDEFQYISPSSKKQAEEKMANAKSQEIPTLDEARVGNSVRKLEDPDFDIDDESKPKEPIDEYLMEEDDIEDYEDEADFEEMEGEKEEEFSSEVTAEDDEFDLDIFEEEETENAQENYEKDDDLNLDELDLGSDEPEQTLEENIDEEAHDEINLQENLEVKKDDLDLEAIAKEYEEEHPEEFHKTFEPTVENAAENVEQTIEQHDEPLNFDDLQDEPEQEIKAKEAEEIPSFSEPEAVSQNIADVVLEKKSEKTNNNFDGELEKLDKELEKQNIEAEKKKLEIKMSPLEEIDLEFEKEIMGFRPQFTDENSQEVAKEESKIVEETENIVFENVAPTQIETEIKISENIKNHEPIQLAEETPAVSFEAPKPPVEPIQQVTKSRNFDSMIREETVLQASDSIRRLMDAKNVVEGISTFSKSPAFSELALRIMEPKLEKWLNENLPELVENIVRDEIKKIIPKE